MSVSKKKRFEIFKRDGFRCCYCGNIPPKIVLEVDHINPVSDGGTNDPNNLLTSCFDCNRGKSNIKLSRITPKLEENLEILKEKEQQLKEFNRFIAKINIRISKDIEEIDCLYNGQYQDWIFSDNFKKITLRRFLDLMPKHEILSSLRIAISRFPSDKDRVIRYFCGICWKKIKGEE